MMSVNKVFLPLDELNSFLRSIGIMGTSSNYVTVSLAGIVLGIPLNIIPDGNAKLF